MNGISWRYVVIRVPFGERDPEEILQQRLHTMHTYYRIITATIRDEGWTLIVEDREVG